MILVNLVMVDLHLLMEDIRMSSKDMHLIQIYFMNCAFTGTSNNLRSLHLRRQTGIYSGSPCVCMLVADVNKAAANRGQAKCAAGGSRNHDFRSVVGATGSGGQSKRGQRRYDAGAWAPVWRAFTRSEWKTESYLFWWSRGALPPASLRPSPCSEAGGLAIVKDNSYPPQRSRRPCIYIAHL